VDDHELIAAAKESIGRSHGLTSASSARLVGTSARELHDDARTMARELGVDDPTQRKRDERGRFTGSMNEIIRRASGRVT
jgi:hypothetical protein